MSESFDVVFQGESESECADSIRAVRKYAKQNGKTRDNLWIADQVFDAFAGKALKWYLRLPVDVRGDWELLQQALLTRWFEEDDDKGSRGAAVLISRNMGAIPSVIPAAAAITPSAEPSTSSRAGVVGRIRLRAPSIREDRFLSKTPWNGSLLIQRGSFLATSDATMALKVRPIFLTSNLYRLELVKHQSSLTTLGAFQNDGMTWNRSFGLLVGVDTPGLGPLKHCRSTFGGPDRMKEYQYWTESWKLDDDLRLTMTGPGCNVDGESLRFAIKGKDGDLGHLLRYFGPRRSLSSNGDYAEVELEFEPLGLE